MAADGERLVMSIEGWLQRWKVAQVFYDWQTLIAGVLVLLAGFGTVVATMIIARRQIAASREEADRVIAATRAQTEATFKQTEATVRLEDLRKASEALAFYVMLEAAMVRVLAEAGRARRTYLPILTQTAGLSLEGLVVRQCITKGAFAELRAACVRQGTDLTGEFLHLEGEIESFASQYEDRPTVTQGVTIRMGKLAGLDEQLATIERKANALRKEAFARFSGSVAAPEPFATAEVEALIGTAEVGTVGAEALIGTAELGTAGAEALIGTAAPKPKRRSWLRYWFGWRAAGPEPKRHSWFRYWLGWRAGGEALPRLPPSAPRPRPFPPRRLQ
jgi:hypothetical protein